jgi:toxic protein SymE
MLHQVKPRRKPGKRPEARSLKIQPKTRFNKYSQKDVPEIKLCGEWLEKLGFVYGQRVSITTMHRLLVIRLEEEH